MHVTNIEIKQVLHVQHNIKEQYTYVNLIIVTFLELISTRWKRPHVLGGVLYMHVSSQSFFITSYSVPFWSRAISFPSLPRPQHHKKTLQAVIHFSVWFILEYQEKIRRTRNTCSKYLEDLNMRANETRIYF